MRVWVLAALLVVAWAAERVHAHGGGGFRGPSGGVPPGLRDPPEPGPPPPQSAGWKYFRYWWSENRETILDRKARLLADPTRTFVPGTPPSPTRVRRLERTRDRAILPVLRRFLAQESTPPRARLAALRSLGRCGGSQEAALLIDLIDRTEEGASEELHTALVALGRVRAEDSGRLYRCAFRVLRDPMRTARTRVAAAVALGLQGDAGVSRQLVALLRNEPLPREVKHAVVLAIGWIGDPAARQTLEVLAHGLPLRSRIFDERLRACAAHALGLIGDDRQKRASNYSFDSVLTGL